MSIRDAWCRCPMGLLIRDVVAPLLALRAAGLPILPPEDASSHPADTPQQLSGCPVLPIFPSHPGTPFPACTCLCSGPSGRPGALCVCGGGDTGWSKSEPGICRMSPYPDSLCFPVSISTVLLQPPAGGGRDAFGEEENSMCCSLAALFASHPSRCSPMLLHPAGIQWGDGNEPTLQHPAPPCLSFPSPQALSPGAAAVQEGPGASSSSLSIPGTVPLPCDQMFSPSMHPMDAAGSWAQRGGVGKRVRGDCSNRVVCLGGCWSIEGVLEYWGDIEALREMLEH